MKITIQNLALSLFILFPCLSKSQIYDFDSLYDNNVLFKAAINMVQDTFNLYTSSVPLEFSVSGDLKTLAKDRHKDNKYQEMTVRHLLNDSIAITRIVRAKARGNFRKARCKYPPIRLNFSKTEFKIDQFKELEKMKMVVRCMDQAQYEQYLLTEYLAYKILNVLTPYSFKVRLIKLDVTDTGGKFKGGEAYAFILETHDEFEKRMGGEIIKRENLHPNLTNYDYSNLMAVFQYFIGNTDWSIVAGHNIKVFQSASGGKPYAIPYDFDHSGVVDASYAGPHEDLPITDVSQRLFRGFCRPLADFEKSFEVFKEKRSEIYAQLDAIPGINKGGIKRLTDYFDDFYKVIDDPKQVKLEFLDNCIK